MNSLDLETVQLVQRHARVNGPLIELLNERWPAANREDEAYPEAMRRVQAIGQEILDLITAGLL
jgi:hypothetical protein